MASDPRICPLCQKPNACAMPGGCAQTGGGECWCFHVDMTAALARLPDDLRQKACLCKACAEAQGALR